MADEPPSEGTPTGVTRRQLREARRQRELMGESASIDPAIEGLLARPQSPTTAGQASPQTSAPPIPQAPPARPSVLPTSGAAGDSSGGYGAAPPPGRVGFASTPGVSFGSEPSAGADEPQPDESDAEAATPEALTRRALAGVAGPDVVASPSTEAEEHDPPRWRRFLPALLAAVALAVLAAVLWLLSDRLGFSGSQDSETTASPSETGVGDPAVEGPLNGTLPAEVRGGEYSTEGASGSLYTLPPSGYQVDTGAPESATSAYQAQFLGGALPVTLTAWSFEDAEAATAAAEDTVAALGEPADTGVVFPDLEQGTYWIFNSDGLVQIIWHDGATNVYSVTTEDAEVALDFYNGLEF